MKTILGCMGLTEVHVVYADGLNLGPEAVQQGFAEAEAQIAALLG